MTYTKKKTGKKIPIKGKLIVVVEGIDGSGKSTQLRLLEKWLISRNIPVFFTEWNSSETVKQITKKVRKVEINTNNLLFITCYRFCRQI
jgi:dTMP kinase